jgi:NADPH-dependent 2,4-dienoyl-CoA reductase/sulfur reductase-like enzyme/rhodanese-related sulfurtransferase
MTKILIVGGVAGGATAATRIRRLDEDAEIIIIEKSPEISYANCGLPYHIGGVIPNRSSLLLQTVEGFLKRYRIDVRVNQEAIDIDKTSKTLTIKNLITAEEYTESYDTLLLATGAKPIKPEADDQAAKLIFPLHTIADMDAIISHIDNHSAKTVAILGGGFIGLETAENLYQLGLDVTLIQRSGQVLSPLDTEIASLVHDKLIANGIQLLLDNPVKSIANASNDQAPDSQDKLILTLADDQKLAVDFVIAAIGIKPDNSLAVAAGLEIGDSGGIVVDQQMRTSDPDIFAVGDAVEKKELFTQTSRLIALAGPANKQARIAADNICGIASLYKGSAAPTIIKVFDQSVAFTGVNEKTVRSLNLNYDKVYLYTSNHVAYYPGAEEMLIKLLFEIPSGRILGAQIVGKNGVDKRCDVLACAIQTGLTVSDLVQLELSYAPPFSSAKDPINVIGGMAENLLTGYASQFHWHQVDDLPRDGSVSLLDVRTPAEHEGGSIPGFVNIPVDTLRDRLDELDVEKPVFLHCQSGLRSYIALRILRQKGYIVSHLSGGWRLYAQTHRG